MKLKKLVSDTSKYWYAWILSFCFLEILNVGVLRIFVPEAVCFWISAFLILMFLVYFCLAISVLYDHLTSLFRKKTEELNLEISNLKRHIDELDCANKELSKELAESLSNDISSGNDTATRTIQADLLSSKDCIVGEVRVSYNSLTEAINEASGVLASKSNTLIELQDKCTEKIINNEKSIATESSALLKGKVDFITEQHSTLINALSTELKDIGRENAHSVNESLKATQDMLCKNHADATAQHTNQYNDIVATIANAQATITSGIEEAAYLSNNAISAHNTDVLQHFDDAKSDLMQNVEYLKESLAKVHCKSDDIIMLGNTIIENQHQNMEELRVASENICETQVRQFGDIRDAICTSSEKTDTFIQSSSAEITTHITEQINSLNTYLLEAKHSHDVNIANVEEKVIALHSETSKLINLLVENIDDASEKNEQHINLLGNQIAELAKLSADGIQDLLSEIELSQEQTARLIGNCTSEHAKTSANAERSILDHVTDLSKYYAKYFEKIDHIQAEVFNISHATNLLNQLYSKLQSNTKATSDSSAHKNDSPERTEEYKDPESGATVKNHYKHNKLVLSEMVVAGRIAYDIRYGDDGKAVSSRNYNNCGDIVSEIEFYKNGQVRTRKELLVINGKKETVISHFDEKGNKIK